MIELDRTSESFNEARDSQISNGSDEPNLDWAYLEDTHHELGYYLQTMSSLSSALTAVVVASGQDGSQFCELVPDEFETARLEVSTLNGKMTLCKFLPILG